MQVGCHAGCELWETVTSHNSKMCIHTCGCGENWTESGRAQLTNLFIFVQTEMPQPPTPPEIQFGFRRIIATITNRTERDISANVLKIRLAFDTDRH